MKKLIKDICNIQTGLFAKPSDKGEVVYLQAKHFDELGRLVTVLHPDLQTQNVSSKHLLQAGDVLFAAKGMKNFAAVYEQHNEPAVASTSFFVLRLFEPSVLPEYLAWFLNSTSTQIVLKTHATGTAIPSISKAALQDLELSIPSLKLQDSVLQIIKLRRREKALKVEIEKLREKQIDQIIINCINL